MPSEITFTSIEKIHERDEHTHTGELIIKLDGRDVKIEFKRHIITDNILEDDCKSTLEILHPSDINALQWREIYEKIWDYIMEKAK
ncbi:MAG: hypothetical protein WC755_07055 [Candidatus Woesearchaeota archaeon]|jgi:hypothetical protein